MKSMYTLNRFRHWMHISVLSLFMLSAIHATAQDGEKLFKANCASCHKIDKKLVGPALQGTQERWPDLDNLRAWIRNSQQYLTDNPNDAYAKGIYEEYNKMIMPAMPLSDSDIDAILTYISNPSPGASATADSAGTAVPTQTAPEKDYTLYWLIAFTLILLVVIKVLMDVKKSVKGLLYEVKGEETFKAMGEEADLEASSNDQFRSALSKNKILVALVGVSLLVLVLNVVWESLMGVGIYEGYAPEQPIKFSHKIHAGDNGINCVYCHSSAEKGKHSGIPSVNVCMNCHKGIQEGKRWGTEEISKIYTAAGFNPETNEYDSPGKPIKWIRIHNLPDHVYFNHSQHVVVGKVECQTCHGPVETYDYPMQQYSELTMGWCINCHRETDVKMDGNAYYEKLHAELVEKYKDQGLEKFTVEQIGGLECAKCHY